MRFQMNLSNICMSLGGIDVTPLYVREEDQLGAVNFSFAYLIAKYLQLSKYMS